MDQVEEVKSKTDIVSIISEHLELKKAGRNYKASCPFHSERTPSFMISPELQTFKCFGCGESGDVFTFLEKEDGMDFYEALKYLADRAGVKLKRTNTKARSEREQIYELNNLTKRFYQYVLLKHKAGKEALEYLQKNRGLKLETIKTFQLGYSPASPGALKSFLIDKKKNKAEDIERAGIGYRRGASIVDRFRGRVIFPLFDHRGNPIGFAGRLLPSSKSEMAKYINSPETPAYHKGNVLYGFEITKKDIKKKGEAVVVEGELDLISSWQAGIKEVVAMKGTALTEEQVRLLSRYTDSLVLALDSDVAGDSAARRGITIAQNQGLEVKVARLKGFKDPDEAARKDIKAYKKYLKEAVDVWEFIIDSVISKNNKTSGAGKAKISRELIPVLATIEDKIVQAHYVKVLARRLDIPFDSVAEEVSKRTVEKKVEVQKEAQKTKSRREKLEERLLTIAFHSNPRILLEDGVEESIITPLAKRIYKEYKTFGKGKKDFDVASFASQLPKELAEGFSTMILMDTKKSFDGDSFKKELELVKRELRILDLKGVLLKSAEKIKNLEKKDSISALKKEEEKFAKYSNMLSELE